MKIFTDFVDNNPSILPLYNINTDQSIGFNSTIQILSRFKKNFCDLWDEIGYY